MNRIDCLVSEMCPNGVEYKPLRDVATVSRGGSFQKKDYVESGFPCIHYGQIYTTYGLFVKKTVNFISRETANKQKKAVTGDVIMAVTSENIEDICKCVAWLGEGEVAVSGHTAIIHHNQDPKYLVYYLQSSLFYKQKTKLVHGTKVMEVSPNSLLDIVIPFPPLTIQREIVRILDNFTELTTELIAKLTGELAAREQQYKYYNNSMLRFPNAPYYTLEDLCEIVDYRGKTPKKTDNGVFLVTAKNIRKGYIDYNKSQEYIAEDDYEIIMHRGYPRIGDVLITTEAPCGNVALVDKEHIALAQRVIKYRPKTERLNSIFLKYILLGKEFQEKLMKNATGGTVKGIKGSRLHKLTIPVPSIDEQERIVSILDHFDSLCNDVIAGLLIEITARQKQYEYYRDKLLTFRRNAEVS